jgi:hypothetical protein
MGAAEVEAFLTHVAVKENVAASTRNKTLFDGLGKGMYNSDSD